MTFDIDNLRPRFTWSGDGDGDVLPSLAARAFFHGLDEACFPGPLQDVGKRLAEDGHEIAPMYFSYVTNTFYFHVFPRGCDPSLGLVV